MVFISVAQGSHDRKWVLVNQLTILKTVGSYLVMSLHLELAGATQTQAPKHKALLLCAGWGYDCSNPWLLFLGPVGLVIEALYSCANYAQEILEEAVASLTEGQGCYYCVSGYKFELQITPQQGKPSVGQGFL